MEVVDTVHRHFPSLSDDLVTDIEKYAGEWKVKANDVIMDIGSKISSVPLLIQGMVKVFREDENGNELFLYYLYPGEACAISLVCSTGKEKISSIRAVAVEDSKFITFPIDKMDKWMQKHKSWYEYVLGTYRYRFEELLNTVDDIAFHNMDERLLSYLDKNVEAQGSRTIQTSHQEIAYELNTSREVISRLLKKLEQRGKVKLARNKIEVLY